MLSTKCTDGSTNSETVIYLKVIAKIITLSFANNVLSLLRIELGFCSSEVRYHNPVGTA